MSDVELRGVGVTRRLLVQFVAEAIEDADLWIYDEEDSEADLLLDPIDAAARIVDALLGPSKC